VHLQKALQMMSTSVYALSVFHEISQYVYELHSDEVQVFLGTFQQIAPALNRCTAAFSQDVFSKKNPFLN
jgi:hypothetical protein